MKQEIKNIETLQLIDKSLNYLNNIFILMELFFLVSSISKLISTLLSDKKCKMQLRNWGEL